MDGPNYSAEMAQFFPATVILDDCAFLLSEFDAVTFRNTDFNLPHNNWQAVVHWVVFWKSRSCFPKKHRDLKITTFAAIMIVIW
ncbi:MAG TPA: hypothetical protein VNB49_12410, partial [Candidatus Dormibacteraeota bacterium]|nr:hypothetical protein [Candidatus Dormibacteraeota bacterium]